MLRPNKEEIETHFEPSRPRKVKILVHQCNYGCVDTEGEKYCAICRRPRTWVQPTVVKLDLKHSYAPKRKSGFPHFTKSSPLVSRPATPITRGKVVFRTEALSEFKQIFE